MFAQFAKLAGYAQQFAIAAEDDRIKVLLSGRTTPLVTLFNLMNVAAPASKPGMLRFLQGDALLQAPIRGDAAQAWPLFCKAASAALRGDRTLCDTYETDAKVAIATAKAGRAARKALKSANAPTVPAVPAVPAVPTVVSFVANVVDPVTAALDVVNAAVNAGTLTDAQCGMLRSMVERLAVAI